MVLYLGGCRLICPLTSSPPAVCGVRRPRRRRRRSGGEARRAARCCSSARRPSGGRRSSTRSSSRCRWVFQRSISPLVFRAEHLFKNLCLPNRCLSYNFCSTGSRRCRAPPRSSSSGSCTSWGCASCSQSTSPSPGRKIGRHSWVCIGDRIVMNDWNSIDKREPFVHRDIPIPK